MCGRPTSEPLRLPPQPALVAHRQEMLRAPPSLLREGDAAALHQSGAAGAAGGDAEVRKCASAEAQGTRRQAAVRNFWVLLCVQISGIKRRKTLEAA